MTSGEVNKQHHSCRTGGDCCANPCGPVYRNEDYAQAGEIYASPPEVPATESDAGKEAGVDPFERSQINQLRQMDPRRLEIIIGLLSSGMVYGSLVNQQASQWYLDAHTVLAEQAERQERPKAPKRPKGKAKRVGSLALGNT